MQNPLYKLARLTSEHLKTTDYSQVVGTELSKSFSNDLDSVLDRLLPEQVSDERQVRALNYAPIVLGKNVPSKLTELYNAARSAFGQVRWTEFYEEDSWSKSFLPLFANGEGIGPDGRLKHNEVILGLFLLGPNVTYPEHAHPAEEFYIVLTGNPEFKVGSNNFKLQEAGAVVLHHNNVSHAIRTSSEPFFAIFGWRGEIGAKSWYRNNMTEESEPKKYPTIKKT
jgi:mannose-6-phosphate isomerase-like protein (cupin superfamily)